MLDRVNADGSARAEQMDAPRVQFKEQLGSRLDKLRAALRQLPNHADKVEAQQRLQQRCHALAEASKLLGFEAAGELLAETEQLLEPAPEELGGERLATAERNLERVPGLVFQQAAAPDRVADDAAPPLEPTRSASGEQPTRAARLVLALVPAALEVDLRVASGRSGRRGAARPGSGHAPRRGGRGRGSTGGSGARGGSRRTRAGRGAGPAPRDRRPWRLQSTRGGWTLAARGCGAGDPEASGQHDAATRTG